MANLYSLSSGLSSSLKSSKKKKFILILILLLLLSPVIYFVYSGLKNDKPEDTSDANEPEVEVSGDVLAENFELTYDENSSSNDSGTGQPASNNGNNNNSSSNTKLNVTKIKNITKISHSPDGKYLLVLAGTSSNAKKSLPFIQEAKAESSDGQTLYLANSNGEVITIIEVSKIYDADFADNEHLYYQTIGTGAGVYLYGIKDKSKKILEYTYDTQSFRNITPINETRYFFNQPSTGKLGFGEVGTTRKTVLETKQISTNYAESSSFDFVTVSPDKKYVAFIEKVDGENFEAKLKLYPTTASSSSDLYFETTVKLTPRDLSKDEQVILWSADSKYVVAGEKVTTVDITAKKVVFEKDGNNAITDISSDGLRLIFIDLESANLTILDISQNKTFTVNERVSQARFLSKDIVLLVIGERLYVYSISTQSLKAVNTTKAETLILDTNPVAGIAWVKQGEEIIKLKISTKG